MILQASSAARTSSDAVRCAEQGVLRTLDIHSVRMRGVLQSLLQYLNSKPSIFCLLGRAV